MNEIVAIARNTFKEAIRNRILYIILIFALLLIAVSGVISELSIAHQLKVIKNLGFASINFFAVAIAVFVGVTLVYNELEKKSIYTIVSKPISRGHFLLGKYFGLLLTVWVNMLLMTYFFLVAIHFYTAMEGNSGWVVALFSGFFKALLDMVWWQSEGVTANIMTVTAITALEMTIVTAFSVFYSSFSTPTLSMIFTVMTFIMGRMNEDIIRFSEQIYRNAVKAARVSGGQLELPVSYYLTQGAAYVVPNLGAFSVTVEQAVYEPKVEIWWGTIVYGLLYTAGILTLSILIFMRRNFK
jgi:ABC-type transport system involved in multi-copper enzyme maturation permease subunit